MRKIMAIVGVRPQIIKAAPVLHFLKGMRRVELQLVHSGQHYDYEMSRVFFKDFCLPDPLMNLKVRSGSHARQTAAMMIRVEDVIKACRPNIVVVFGDANTTLAGALSAVKLGVRVAHVEAGLRCGDMRMSEEINRIVVDHCSQLLFAPTGTAVRNLREEGISGDRVKMFGDTMVDSMIAMRPAIADSEILNRFNLEAESYAVLTTHRAENVDNRKRLCEIVRGIAQLRVTVVFPVHPRTDKALTRFGLRAILARAHNVRLTKPLGYLDMLELVRQSRVLLTDSGGLQKEAFMLHVPCLTIRDSTEWVETLGRGANKLIGADANKIRIECKRIFDDAGLKSRLSRLSNPFGDGKAAPRIARVLLG